MELRGASHAETVQGLRAGDRIVKPPFSGPARRQFEIRERGEKPEAEQGDEGR